MTNSKRNEHPRCGCRMCKRGAGGDFGQWLHTAVNRRIRHRSKQALRTHGEDFERVVISTGYTD